MLREPECSINQTKFSVSRQTSMKWLPPPSVPSCFIAFALRSWTPSCSSLKSFQPSQYEDSSTDSLYALKPTGIASSIAKRKSFNLPSRIPLLNGVFTAIMPQPMSTPTVAGITASFVAIGLVRQVRLELTIPCLRGRCLDPIWLLTHELLE